MCEPDRYDRASTIRMVLSHRRAADLNSVPDPLWMICALSALWIVAIILIVAIA